MEVTKKKYEIPNQTKRNFTKADQNVFTTVLENCVL